MNIFLDDLRDVPKTFDICFRTGEAMLEWFEQHLDTPVELVSLDHDLGDGRIDGYEIVKRLVELQPNIKHFQFHTDNLVGFKNMYFYLSNAERHGLLPNTKSVNDKKFDCIDGVMQASPYKVI